MSTVYAFVAGVMFGFAIYEMSAMRWEAACGSLLLCAGSAALAVML